LPPIYLERGSNNPSPENSAAQCGHWKPISIPKGIKALSGNKNNKSRYLTPVDSRNDLGSAENTFKNFKDY
jgi:hypothetical protein